jgi:hypothetical protein
MRDYGIVRIRFWEWAKRKELDADERELALYLLTSPHGNSLGCYRLPMAYLCDDLAKDAGTVAKALARLSAIGFLERDEASGWTWIRGFLDHNPIPNRNVGKAIEKQVDAVPVGVPFYADLIGTLRSGDKALSPAFLDRMEERFRNRSDTVTRGSKTHTQTQTQTHEHQQTHEHEHSEAEASDAGASRQVIDLRKEVFDAGIEILVAAGKREGNARSMIGKWRKDHGNEATLAAIRQAGRDKPSEPVSYITACLRTSHPTDEGPRTAAEIEAEADAALAGVDYR